MSQLDYYESASDYFNCAQSTLIPKSVENTRIINEITTNTGSTAVYNESKLTTWLNNVCPFNNMILQLPIRIDYYVPTGTLPSQIKLSNMLMSDLGLLDCIYEIQFKLDKPIGMQEYDKIYHVKATISDAKYNDDELAILGNFGLFSTSTITTSYRQVSSGDFRDENLSWRMNPKSMRDSFINLINSMNYNSVLTSKAIDNYTIPSGDYQSKKIILDKYSMTCYLPMPVKYLHSAFRANGKFPPNFPFSISIRSYKEPVIAGVLPQGVSDTIKPDPKVAYFTTYLDVENSRPQLYYTYDEMSLRLKEDLINFRKNDFMSFNQVMYNNYIVSGQTGPNYQLSLALQQEMPNEIIIRTIATQTTANYFGGVITPNNIPIPTSIMLFKDGLSHLTGGTSIINGIKEIKLFNNGLERYRQLRELNQKIGPSYPTCSDIIFQNQLIESYQDLTLDVKDYKRTQIRKPFSQKVVNANISFVFVPGGVTGGDLKGNSTDAQNVSLNMQLDFPTDDNIFFHIIKKTNGQLLIFANNSTKQVIWPEEYANNVTILSPSLAN